MAIIRKRLTTVQKFIVWLQSLVLKVQSGINSYLSVSFGKLKNDNPGVFLLEFRHTIAGQNRPCECRLAMLLAGACAPAAWSAAVARCYTTTARVSRLFVIGSLVKQESFPHTIWVQFIAKERTFAKTFLVCGCLYAFQYTDKDTNKRIETWYMS